MLDPISIGLQAATVIMTWVSSWLIGNKSLLGPLLAIGSCLLLIIVNAYAGLWILIPMCAVSAVIQGRNYIKWKRET